MASAVLQPRCATSPGNVLCWAQLCELCFLINKVSQRWGNLAKKGEGGSFRNKQEATALFCK